jgi:hypothetical protein
MGFFVEASMPVAKGSHSEQAGYGKLTCQATIRASGVPLTQPLLHTPSLVREGLAGRPLSRIFAREIHQSEQRLIVYQFLSCVVVAKLG